MENKKCKVTRLECLKPDWVRVVNAARRTVGKAPITKEPSENFKYKVLLAEHSPIRLLEYDFTWEDIRQWITAHFVRHHEGCEKFVHTQRTDRNEKLKGLNRDKLPQGLLNDMDMTCNAQSFINISRKRLCSCASTETRNAWKLVIKYLKEIDPALASKCVPECIYRGFCSECDKSCGYVNTDDYKRKLVYYRQYKEEKWVPLIIFNAEKGYEIKKTEDYEISSWGRIRKNNKEIQIFSSKTNIEYFYYDGIQYKLSHAVYRSFNGDFYGELIHVDGNPFNNTLDNLKLEG